MNDCPQNAIRYIDESKQFSTDLTKCNDCRNCTENCLPGSRTAYGYDASVDELMQEIEKDSLFYFHSGGGVTISGGEATMQPDFLRELLERCLYLGLNTALETCGYTKWENLEKSLPFLDTVFFDLKHMDSIVHKQITGVTNNVILENIQKLDAHKRQISLIVRMPVIPSINDSLQNMTALGEFCQGLTKLKEIQLLPYHRLGIETYQRLSISYNLENLSSMKEDELKEKAEILQQMDHNVVVGS